MRGVREGVGSLYHAQLSQYVFRIYAKVRNKMSALLAAFVIVKRQKRSSFWTIFKWTFDTFIKKWRKQNRIRRLLDSEHVSFRIISHYSLQNENFRRYVPRRGNGRIFFFLRTIKWFEDGRDKYIRGTCVGSFFFVARFSRRKTFVNGIID